MPTSRNVVSPLFHSDAGGTIVFSSLDHCLFYLHRESLKLGSGKFPLTLAEYGGVVYLTEKGSILELLFSYVYPNRLPELNDISFETLLELAQAAEKYDVYLAKSMCVLKMMDYLDTSHRRQILDFGLTHGYSFFLRTALLRDQWAIYDI
ncbi:hypothetical protein VKT23_015911 [Stygiomarasmius scandens]|uniref:BTB domain-containing protein n=1 Tax=Marasmiellus scandens TaxID=2682957 RepID=A0ABR1IYL1_9AGAR